MTLCPRSGGDFHGICRHWAALARARSATRHARPKRYWTSAPTAVQGIVAEVNTLMAEHRETVTPPAASDLLHDDERRLHLVSGNDQIAIAHCDTEGRYKFVNRHYAEWHGLAPEQV